MATLGTNAFTLADWAKRRDPDGKSATIVELLSQTNSILDDAIYMEGNLPTGHQCTVRTGLPTVYWKILNQGTPPSKSTTAQVTEACGILNARSHLDVDIAELEADLAATRLNEASSFLEAMSQEMASTMFYGNSSLTPEEFTGLSVRYSSLSAANAQNIVNAGGSGSDNCSIWLIVWGANGVYNIFPKGSNVGLYHEDMGIQNIYDSTGISGSVLRAYQDEWKWKTGLVVKDWRQAVRIANIDVSNLVAESSNADLVESMIKAMHRVHSLNLGKPVFYMNRTCLQMLDIQRLDRVGTGGGITYDSVDGMVKYSFRGVPIKVCDALTQTESAVS